MSSTPCAKCKGLGYYQAPSSIPLTSGEFPVDVEEETHTLLLTCNHRSCWKKWKWAQLLLVIFSLKEF